MAKAPIWRLPKATIVELAKGRCKHGHSYLEHYGCWLEERTEHKRIGFFDIETSNFKADFGIMFSYSILDNDTDKMYGRLVTAKELRTVLDHEVVKQMVEDFYKFDVIVGYYSTKFDLPFSRTRAKILRIPFPEYGEIQHKDVYYIVKSKFALSRSRQEVAARMLVGKTEKTHIMPDQWLHALTGKAEALDYIFDHNKKDVRDLKRLYHEVIPYVMETTRSI